MVCQHLVVIVSSFFEMDDDDLLDPEGELGEVVEFHGGADVEFWELSPQG